MSTFWSKVKGQCSDACRGGSRRDGESRNVSANERFSSCVLLTDLRRPSSAAAPPGIILVIKIPGSSPMCGLSVPPAMLKPNPEFPCSHKKSQEQNLLSSIQIITVFHHKKPKINEKVHNSNDYRACCGELLALSVCSSL